MFSPTVGSLFPSLTRLSRSSPGRYVLEYKYLIGRVASRDAIDNACNWTGVFPGPLNQSRKGFKSCDSILSKCNHSQLSINVTPGSRYKGVWSGSIITWVGICLLLIQATCLFITIQFHWHYCSALWRHDMSNCSNPIRLVDDYEHMPLCFSILSLFQREAQSWDQGQKSVGDPPVQRLQDSGAGTGPVVCLSDILLAGRGLPLVPVGDY